MGSVQAPFLQKHHRRCSYTSTIMSWWRSLCNWKVHGKNPILSSAGDTILNQPTPPSPNLQSKSPALALLDNPTPTLPHHTQPNPTPPKPTPPHQCPHHPNTPHSTPPNSYVHTTQHTHTSVQHHTHPCHPWAVLRPHPLQVPLLDPLLKDSQLSGFIHSPHTELYGLIWIQGSFTINKRSDETDIAGREIMMPGIGITKLLWGIHEGGVPCNTRPPSPYPPPRI